MQQSVQPSSNPLTGYFGRYIHAIDESLVSELDAHLPPETDYTNQSIIFLKNAERKGIWIVWRKNKLQTHLP